MAHSWHRFDGYYFFNPLAENLFAEGERIDDHVELTHARFARDVLHMERELRSAPLDTVVITYHGSSGRIPACYELDHQERAASDFLRVWIKRAAVDDGSFYVEGVDGIEWHRATGRAG
jgi:hypothetical protein